ncbi:MAG: metallophosphoesterase [Proteobacteria bacterium]|nr:metallophosphoesterase [Pseudomonadota bacterium]
MGMVRDQPFDRVVAIGDLNGAYDVLRDILLAMDIIDQQNRWIGGRAHLIQIGDVFNRGGRARDALRLLDALRRKAPADGGRVTVLLGNHEVMTVLGNEAYCTTEEYLSFASHRQRRLWPKRVERAMRELYHDHPPDGPILPLEPRLEEWKILNVPGRTAMRRALSSHGELGRIVRRLPIAVIAADCVFCHAAITPVWARLGIDGLNRAAERAWRSSPRFFEDLPHDGIFYAKQGPLWNRQITLRDNARTRQQLDRSLLRLQVERMVVGHTQTENVPGGEKGRIALRHQERLVCIDVGLGREVPSPRTALLIEGGRGLEWTPSGTRVLWQNHRTSPRSGRPRPRARRAKASAGEPGQ